MNTATGTRRQIGRFQLQRVLGRGAQATVWLAHDERLDRDVAVKLLDPGADADSVNQWLHEARAVSRLAHPHVVPVFEADESEGQPYLVFEYVDGPTLSQALRERGALPPLEAVRVMDGILAALAGAHAQGIVHRDLKPSNVLVGRDGRARVMDFGIAARVAAGSDGRIVGTPGYMSPEAARGEAPKPAMDVFSAGMLLAEMLGGVPLLRERDPWVAIRRVQDEDLMLAPSVQVDEALRAVVQRAIARDPAQRFADAAAMQRALAQWAQPPAAEAGSGGGTLEFLLRRMRSKTDFPALSASVMRIQRVASSERESLGSLANEILKDVALTNKLLRMVNSAHFSQAAGGGVSTVSRAVALVGFAGIRNMALSVVLMEHMKDKAHAHLLKTEFLRSLLAGQLAGELCAPGREAEEAFLGSMLQNLGRLVSEFYLPDEAAQVRALVQPTVAAGAALAPPLDEATAAARILGTTYEELGAGVAKAWGLPEGLRALMRRPVGEPPGRPLPRGPEQQRWTAALANDVADALLACEPAEAERRIAALAERHGRALGVSPESLGTSTAAARDKLRQMVDAMSMDLAPASPARRLLGQAPTARPGGQAGADPDSITGLALHATRATADLLPADEPTLVVAPKRAREEIAQMLSAGIQDITNSMVADSFKLNEVLRMVLETMYRALHFRRVIFCLRDPRIEAITGRFGLGERASELAPHFQVPLRLAAGLKPDLFTAVCLKGADTLISDASAPGIAARLPAWHARHLRAPSFLLLPLSMKGAPFALIYADKASAGELELDDKELNLLRTLRNQAVMAFRQAG